VFITYKSDTRLRRSLLLLAATTLMACGSSQGPADAEEAAADSGQSRRGELLSYACLACHTVEEGGEHQIGPSLYGLFGRPAASLPGFDYSEALRDSGIVWSPADLDRWLADPAGFLPGTTMAFSGYQQPRDRQALIEFLVAATSP
jgi:cytochrome c